MKKLFALVSLLVLASLILSACGTPATPAPTEPPVAATEPPAPTEPPMPAWEAPAGAFVAYPVDAAPTLDGVGDEAFWADAEEIVVDVDGGFGDFATEVHLKAVYTADSIYFLVTYEDPTESWFRSPWQKQKTAHGLGQRPERQRWR